MYNWSVDEEKFKKAAPEGYQIWRLEQTVNYGEPGEKIDGKLLKKYWSQIRDRIDPRYRKLLELFLWPSQKAS